MFDTVAGKFEKGPYVPKSESRNSWETRTREYYDPKLKTDIKAVVRTLNLPQVRIAIMGDAGILSFESSLPKLIHGNNVAGIYDPAIALTALHEFIADHVTGEIPELQEAAYQRVDYCHNFFVGNALSDYVSTLASVSFLKHHRLTDRYGGVEWWNHSRRVRVYDKHKEILEVDKKNVSEARGILRFEIQLRKKSRFLERRLAKKNLTLQDILEPALAYACLTETLNRMCLDLRFVPQDLARNFLDEAFPYRKATRLLGIVQRMRTEPMSHLRTVSARSTYYADKRDLRSLGLWPACATTKELPGLAMPPIEHVLERNQTNTCASA